MLSKGGLRDGRQNGSILSVNRPPYRSLTLLIKLSMSPVYQLTPSLNRNRCVPLVRAREVTHALPSAVQWV
jgi:hypothetical protein